MKLTDFACYVSAVAIVLLLVWRLVPHSNPGEARRVLEDSGYSDVKIDAMPRIWGRGENWYATGFEATSASGHRVTGMVTGGLFFAPNVIHID